MSELLDTVLSNMSEKFNQAGGKMVEINLNDDKTLKWRGLHNNQYAAAKRRKDGTKQQRAAVRSKSTQSADDPPPLMNDSGSSSNNSNGSSANNNNNSSINNSGSNSSSNSNSSHCSGNGTTTNNKPTTSTTTAPVASSSSQRKQNDEFDLNGDLSVDVMDDDSEAIKSISNRNNHNSHDTMKCTNSMDGANVDDTSNDDKNNLIDNDSKQDAPQLRRTLRRKANTTGDDQSQHTDDTISNAKKSLRSKRQTLQQSDSMSDCGSITVKSEDGKMSETASTHSDSIVTRRRGRARKLETNEMDDAISNEMHSSSQPLKLRRSERMHGSTTSIDHSKEPTPSNEASMETVHGIDQTSMIDITITRKTRQRTVDEKRTIEPKDEPEVTLIAVPKKDECVVEPTTVIDVDKIEDSPSIKDEAEVESSNEIQAPRKRGRKPGSTKIKSKTDLKLNTSVGTRNSPTKKSPRVSSDESPFFCSIPKRDKNEVAQPQQRLSRRIKPTPKILANEELRQGFELQNNARLSNSNEHLDDENVRSPPRRETNAIISLPTPQIQPQPELKSSPKRVEKEETVIVIDDKEPEVTVKKSPPRTPPKRHSTSPIQQKTEFIRPTRRPCPDPERLLNEIKMAKINLHRSPEDNKKLNNKQKKRLNKMKERHFFKLGLQRVSKSTHKDGDTSGSELIESDDNEEFVPTQKINVGRPNVTLRVRGQKDILIYNKNISPAVKAAREKEKKITLRSPPVGATPSQLSPPQLLDRLDRHSKELISRNPEISLISSTKHKMTTEKRLNNMQNGGATTQLTSEVTLSIRKDPSAAIDPNICTCNKVSKYYTRRTDDTFCSAIDQIDNQKIGCGNEVSGELLNLLRPSVRASYMLLCDSHKKRLYAHNCCASCGVFCTQGRFIICEKNHFFHQNCATKLILNAPYDPKNPNYSCPTLVLKCPHCGSDAPGHDSMVSMRCNGRNPVFTTSPKKLVKPARMSIGTHSHRTIKTRDESYLMDIERLVPDTIEAILVRAQNGFPFSEDRTFSSKDVFYAVTKNDIERMAEIIASGFDITTPIKEFHNGTCLHLVANFGSITMTYLIISRVSSIDFFNQLDNKLRTAIMCSIYGKRNDILKLLIQCGADVAIKGIDGMSALHLAAKLSNSEAIEILLEGYQARASHFQLEKCLNGCDDGGWTSLMWAADLGNAEICSSLLRYGANVNVCDAENNTALHWATLSDNIETVTLILEHGSCGINTQNINGDTPLHISCRNGNARISLFLLAHGASLDMTNNANEAPYDCISEENGPCGRAIFFNLQIRNIAGLPEENIICQDISNGREEYPIQVVSRKRYKNDRPTSAHSDSDTDHSIPDFKYISKTILLQNSIQIDRRVSQMRICSCLDGCTSSNCQCGEISIQNWYTTEGRLNGDFNFHDPAMIFECNDVCGCNKLLCKNRVVQDGSKIALQIFECGNRVKGFGVRGITEIPRGTFIAEYVGEILTDIEADRRTDDSYFFDLGASEHCIDANFYGNVSRFFNHSCEPNMIPIRVYYEHQDLRFPKIAFFATRNIEAGEELTFDYGEKFWISKHKQFTCHCGAASCRFSDKTIAKTLEEYNQRNTLN